LYFKLKKRAYHLQVRHYLSNNFRYAWIGGAAPKHGAPRSPNLTPLGFLAWASFSLRCTEQRFLIFMTYGNTFTKQHKHWHSTCFVLFSELPWNIGNNVVKWKGASYAVLSMLHNSDTHNISNIH
jgi:hypothetical protein